MSSTNSWILCLIWWTFWLLHIKDYIYPWQQVTNCLSVFDHFVKLAFKELKYLLSFFTCDKVFKNGTIKVWGRMPLKNLNIVSLHFKFCYECLPLILEYFVSYNELSGYFISKTICDALHDLVPFVQFKKREKHPCRSLNFSKVAGWSLQLY